MTEDMKNMIELVQGSLDEIKSMSKADKMFAELGYEKYQKNSFIKEYDYEYSKYIFFNSSDKSWSIDCELEGDNTLEEHIAVHEKMKELGWLNEQSI